MEIYCYFDPENLRRWKLDKKRQFSFIHMAAYGKCPFQLQPYLVPSLWTVYSNGMVHEWFMTMKKMQWDYYESLFEIMYGVAYGAQT